MSLRMFTSVKIVVSCLVFIISILPKNKYTNCDKLFIWGLGREKSIFLFHHIFFLLMNFFINFNLFDIKKPL